MTKKPVPTPKQNFIVFLNPYLLADNIAIILLGPGVKVVTKTYNKNDNVGKINPPPNVCYNV